MKNELADYLPITVASQPDITKFETILIPEDGFVKDYTNISVCLTTNLSQVS